MNRISFLALSFLTAGVAFAGDSTTFKKEKEIPLAGGASFDYLTADSAGRRLYVAHATKIDVFDLDKGEKLGEVDGVDGAHGAIVVADAKRGFATSGKKNALIVFDPVTFKTIQEVKTDTGPDALMYCATTKEVWTMNHRAKTITCVDAASLEVKATIDVGGTLEFPVEYPSKGLVFVNAERENFVAEIDAKKHVLVKKHELAPAEGPTGLAIDLKKGVLFSGCDQKLAVLDANTGKILATPAIGEGCDAVAYDADRGLAFASCGDGTTTIVRETKPGTFEAVGKIETAKGGRTCAIDEKTHKLWVAAGTRGKDDVRLLVFAPAAEAAK